MMRRVVLAELDEVQRRRLLQRSAVPELTTMQTAADIVAAVRDGGDAALVELGERFGGGRPGGARVSDQELSTAVERLSPTLAESVRRAAAAVESVHRAQRPVDASIEPVPGVVIQRRWTPLRRVGCYVPGGTAPLPSTVVMTVVPARVAGVESIAVATPARPNGAVDPVVLGVAGLLGATEVLAMGGAQAIGALAFGTETIEPVDKIVGPGNAWVTAAKLAIAGHCSIDIPAGPSEALVLVDASATARHAAADLLAQAEHGPDSPVVLLSPDEAALASVVDAVEDMLPNLERRDIVEKALSECGLVVLAEDLDDAISFADAYAPEHLSIHLADADEAAGRITSAGSVYVGDWAPEPVGDYASGANHVLPTGGLARSASPLSTEDFGSWRQIQRLTRAGLEELRPTVVALADAEGLGAHRRAVEVRFEGET